MEEIIHWQVDMPPKKGHYLAMQYWDDGYIQCAVDWFNGTGWGWTTERKTPYDVKYWAIRPKGPDDGLATATFD